MLIATNQPGGLLSYYPLLEAVTEILGKHWVVSVPYVDVAPAELIQPGPPRGR